MKPLILSPGIGDNRPTATLYYGQDVRESLRLLPENSIHTVCTSPPYWGLRNYGEEDEQIGLENSPQEFTETLVGVFREIKRVLRPDGTFWLNLGDSYAAARGGTHQPAETLAGGVGGKTLEGGKVNRDRHAGYNPSRNAKAIGLKHKDLVGIPWRVAFALQADGWYLRSAAPWIKGNCMPESCTDRPTTATEYIFLFAHPDSGGKYFYDIDAVRISHNAKWVQARKTHNASRPNQMRADRRGDMALRYDGKVVGNPAGRNRRNTDPWNEMLEVSAQELLAAKKQYGVVHNAEGDPLAFKVNPKPYSGAHFAVWPPDLVRPMILSGTSEKGCCSKCGAPLKRDLRTSGGRDWRKDKIVSKGIPGETSGEGGNKRGQSSASLSNTKSRVTHGWVPTCSCEGASIVPCTVLDPFSGSATTGMVALQEGRNYVGIDLNSDYLDLAQARIEGRKAPQKPDDDNESGHDIFDLFGGSQ